MATDPLTTTQDATNVGSDVSVGPGEAIPELEGNRRPGALADDPHRAPPPGPNPGANPDNPGDDPGVPIPQPPPDVLATEPSAPPAESGAEIDKGGAGRRAANDAS